MAHNKSQNNNENKKPNNKTKGKSLSRFYPKMFIPSKQQAKYHVLHVWLFG
jgi:hypothetical protein